MAKFNLFPLVCLSSLCLISSRGESVQAQRGYPELSAFLLDGANCRTTTSDGNTNYNNLKVEEGMEVVIGRILYPTPFLLFAERENHIALACDINTEQFDVLQLQLGVADNEVQRESLMTVNIYQGGTVIQTYGGIEAGKVIDTTVDLSNTDVSRPGSVSIELECLSATNRSAPCRLFALEAQLFPTTIGSSRKP